ncbi:MAG: hypothetical protein HOC05_04895, partial [Gemmatimonadetes bacterium]|nr:hypothetical protein [Gemmatimonadota bacterium]
MPTHRFAVLSDIHGNIPALETVLAHAASQDVDDYLIAGDLVGGPEGDAVVERLEPYRHNTIKGNNEEYLIDFHHDAVTA